MSLSVTLAHRFPGHVLDVAFEAPAGLTALFGQSGTGKTTIVNAVAGLLQPDSGRILVNENVLLDTTRKIDVPVHRRRIGYVFQEARLFPHLTVRQNLHYGRWMTGAKVMDDAQIIDLLGIRPLLSRRPGALSGGERQRVALGRALLSAPELLLMDEPLAALDDARKAEILPYLERLRDESGVPILYVSHSIAEVARLATTVVALDGGRIARAGPAAEVLSDPDVVPALGIRDAGAIVSGQVLQHHDDGLSEIALSAGSLLLPRVDCPVGDRMRLRIAAGDVMLGRVRPDGLSALNVLPVTVESLRQSSPSETIVKLRAGEDALLARISNRSVSRLEVAPGLALFAIVKSASIARRNTDGSAG